MEIYGMENGKFMIKMAKYLKKNIQMVKEMEKEKNIMIVVN